MWGYKLHTNKRTLNLYEGKNNHHEIENKNRCFGLKS